MNLRFWLLISTLFVFLSSCQNEETDLIDTPIILNDNVEIYDEEKISMDYVLAIENGSKNAYLLNKQGNKIKEWSFEDNLGNDLEILPDGRLLGMFKVDNPIFSFGGYGGIVKILNNEGEVEWEFEYASENYIAHHDVEMLPNGNVIFLVWEKIDMETLEGLGIQSDVEIYPESLIEVNPTTNQIVWEWHSIDHMIQDVSPSASNYGNISQNPQLINFNYLIEDNGDNWHANGIDVDTDKDVIYISVNYYNEVWVIDHSTTTLEAMSNNGGNYNKGGNLIYRFGNPATYNNSSGEQLFNRNHFPNLIEGNKPGSGNILIYENGVDESQSTIYELEIPESFSLLPETNNEPQIVWSFTNENLFFSRLSGAVRLDNGNTLICEGDYGFWETTTENGIAWKYNGQGINFWRCYGYEIDSPEILNLNL